jgi:aspartate aminotransferase
MRVPQPAPLQRHVYARRVNTLKIAKRVATLVPSATVAVANRAKAMRRDGLDVLSFAAGEPDFDTPDRIKAAAIEALEAGQTKYMPTLGDPETRGVIAEKLRRENGLDGVTGDHVAISAGGKHSLFVACHCLLDPARPGEAPQEVILPVPAWVSYAPIAELAGGRIVPVETTPEAGFRMSPAQLRAAITERSRLLILNSPSNPCGTMYSRVELEALAAVVADAAASIAPDLVVLTDEIYEKIVFDGHEHFSIGSVKSIADRTLTINGLSKAFAMTGWRIGYAAAPGEFGRRLINAMGTLQGQMTTNITSFSYPAIRVALTSCADDVERMRSAFEKRAVLVHKLSNAIDGFRSPRPEGAFYVFPDVSAHFGRTSPAGRPFKTALDFAESLLEEALVACVPGEDFGGCGGNHIRLSFACSEAQIEKGFERIDRFVGGLR